jgi:hypothetical protein
METLGDKIMPKLCPKYFCEICDYGTSKKSSWDNHLLAAKHKKSIKGDVLETNGDKIMPKLCSTNFTCEKCNKNYKSRNGLWKHTKNCLEESNSYNEINELKQIMKYLMKENSEMKNMLIEQQNMVIEVVKHGTTNNSHNTTYTNSHNKAFNLQFFLNETCKDAMNIMDFVESIKLELSDLENVGEVGYIEGISNIIVKNLKELDVTQRPVHCTDKKRETVYIKDDDKWEKDEQNVKLHKLIKKVSSKNQRLLPKFKEKHPDCLLYHSKYSDQYSKIVYESMGGKGDDDYEKEEKIIKNIVKEVVVDKTI